MIICGIPDTIFGLMLHLKSPLEKWDFLEKHFGLIPRPDSWLAAEEGTRQSDSQPEQVVAGETIQSTCDSHHEPEILYTEEEGFPDSPNNCAEIETGYLTPESEVIDVQGVEVNPLVDTQPDECASMLEAPDEDGQHTSNKVKKSQDLLKSSSEVLKPAGNPTRWASRRSMQDRPLIPSEENQHTGTNSKTIANVPDPPGIHPEPSALHAKCSTLQNKPPA
ncbi:hypothetical protein EDC04DRAFT_3139285 [Pisolithus marmoratus]|nr:hypothetical protein EDC04DRAFT_3139285 [Pisolithus marmoratus]